MFKLPSTEQTRVDIWGFSLAPVSQTLVWTPWGATLELSLTVDVCWQVRLVVKGMKMSENVRKCSESGQCPHPHQVICHLSPVTGKQMPRQLVGVWVSLADHWKTGTEKKQYILHPLSHSRLKPVLFIQNFLQSSKSVSVRHFWPDFQRSNIHLLDGFSWQRQDFMEPSNSTL